MSCESVQDLIPTYVLGALDELELRATREHIAGCERCTDELASYAPATYALTIAVRDAAVPRGFNARLLRLASQRRGAPGLERLRWWHPPRLPLALGVASLILALTLGGRIRQLDSQLAREREIDQRVAALMAQPGILDVTLRPAKSYTTGRIYITPGRDVAVLMIGNLPALPENKVYQIWLNGPGRHNGGGTFVPSHDGSARLYLQPPRGFVGYQTVGVTIEPEGGSPVPTSPRVIGGEL